MQISGQKPGSVGTSKGGDDLAILWACLELVRAMRVTRHQEEKQADQYQGKCQAWVSDGSRLESALSDSLCDPGH